MIIPVRCFTCGNVLASKYRKYLEEVQKQERGNAKDVIISAESIENGEIMNTPQKRAMDKLHLTRYCCRRHMISQVDIINYL